ncbi:hypothetical protein [Pseudoxanthomonas sp. z9]|uniref:hypothetical protein n=1 Tax=Pseudoxanthomonas sp. z9 TaxID=2584942 RepID=UPI001144622D|nr:hypothetical protein [Pseudoxanthomonas sp. z9]
MRTLTTKELMNVAGGRNGGDIPPHVQRELEFAYRDARSKGLSHDQAMNACQRLGEGLSVVTGKTGESLAEATSQFCKIAAKTWISALDRSPAAICEQLTGGRWDSRGRTCIQ